MRKLTLSMAAATLATAGVALAAPGTGDHRMPLNGSGGDMTRAQAEAMAAEHFAKMDANGDGVLNQADRAAMRAKVFDRIDANHDGAISRDEFTAMRRGPDAGGAAAGAAPGDHAGMAGHRIGGGRMGGMRGGHRMGGMMMAKMADTDNDGAISRAEFTAAALKHFDMADADHNGSVTQAERQAMMAQMKGKWEQRRAQRQAQ